MCAWDRLLEKLRGVSLFFTDRLRLIAQKIERVALTVFSLARVLPIGTRKLGDIPGTPASLLVCYLLRRVLVMAATKQLLLSCAAAWVWGWLLIAKKENQKIPQLLQQSSQKPQKMDSALN